LPFILGYWFVFRLVLTIIGGFYAIIPTIKPYEARTGLLLRWIVPLSNRHQEKTLRWKILKFLEGLLFEWTDGEFYVLSFSLIMVGTILTALFR